MRVWFVGGAILSAFTLGAACSVTGSDDDGGSGGSRPPGKTEECEAICLPAHPAGEPVYRALRECLLCRACANICAPDVGDLCEPQPDLDGCSQASATCEACVEGPCALLQQPDTTFVGACAAEATTCIQAPDCIAINNCVAECVAAPNPSTSSTTGSGGASTSTTVTTITTVGGGL